MKLLFRLLALVLIAVSITPGAVPGQLPADDRTAKAGRGNLDVIVRAPGTVQPVEVVEVAARVSGTVTRIHADFNAKVEEGTLLAELDDTLARAHFERTRAALRLTRASLDLAVTQQSHADRDWKQVQTLLAKGAVSPGEAEQARAALDAARSAAELARAEVQLADANLKEAQAQLDATHIRSPLKGVVIDRRFNVGQAVGTIVHSPSLFLIARDLRRVQVWATVGENDIAKVRPGQPARFRVAAFPKQVFAAKVTQVRLNAALEKNAVRYTVVLTADNPDGTLLPYLSADVEIVIGQRSSLLVPRGALEYSRKDVPGAGNPSVWVLKEGKEHRTELQRGAAHCDWVEADSADLEEGAEVIVGKK
jgi:HlyD family secretion protein